MTATPDPLEPVFTDYTADTTAEVQHSGTDALWRKAKRRRIGRGATAGAAALALVASASWLLVAGAGADDREPVPAADEPTLSEEDEQYLDALGGPARDLVGTEFALPSFAPGDVMVDEVCANGDQVIEDGSVVEPVEDGAVFLVQTATMYTEYGVGIYQVGLFGCRFGEEALYQATILEQASDDTWTAGTQLVRSEPGGESPQYLRPFVDADGLIVGVAERYDPAAGDLRYRAERVTLAADGTIEREELGDLGTEGFSEQAVRVTATPAGEPGVWTVTVEVHNTGPRHLDGYLITAATDPEVEVLSGGAVNLRTDPLGTWDVVAEIGDLPVGGVFTKEWTVAVDEDAPESYADRPQFMVDIVSSTPRDDMPAVVQELGWFGASGTTYFIE
ncbi:hypothetical protein GCM10009853_019250 [Glycomyces scopariae]